MSLMINLLEKCCNSFLLEMIYAVSQLKFGKAACLDH